jgi:small subunit ribosomal protein S6
MTHLDSSVHRRQALAQNVYECMFILDSNKYAKDPHAVSGQLSSMVEKLDGEVMVSRLWNEQKLAYPIEGHRKGTYWLTYFRIDSEKLVTFNRECQLNGDILRHLTLKVEPRLVDVLVAHARGERLPSETEEETGGDGEAVVAEGETSGSESGAAEAQQV